MEEIERWLMFSYWGSYLKEDYIQVGLDVTEVLMKHWGMARLLEELHLATTREWKILIPSTRSETRF